MSRVRPKKRSSVYKDRPTTDSAPKKAAPYKERTGMDTYIPHNYEKDTNEHRSRPAFHTLILNSVLRWYRIARDWVRKILIS